jgi:hypothetical protein
MRNCIDECLSAGLKSTPGNGAPSSPQRSGPPRPHPKSRDIAANATIANSVDIRLQNDSSYRPSNLKLLNSALQTGYGSETVVI